MLNFKEVNGGQGKGCRGSHPGDKQDAHHPHSMVVHSVAVAFKMNFSNIFTDSYILIQDYIDESIFLPGCANYSSDAARKFTYRYMFQVPGPPPTPPAMVMVITSTPLPPVEWVGPGKGWGSSSQQQCNW